MAMTSPAQNKALVLEAFDTLFNKRDYAAAEGFWSETYIQHSAHIPPGRDGLFNLVRGLPETLRYENHVILAESDYVIAHGRFSGHGRRVMDRRRYRALRRRQARRALGRSPGRSDPGGIPQRSFRRHRHRGTRLRRRSGFLPPRGRLPVRRPKRSLQPVNERTQLYGVRLVEYATKISALSVVAPTSTIFSSQALRDVTTRMYCRRATDFADTRIPCAFSSFVRVDSAPVFTRARTRPARRLQARSLELIPCSPRNGHR